MHLFFLPLLAALAAGQQVCTDCTNESTEPYVHAPAPWTLKGTVYSILLAPILDGILGVELPTKAYPPFERQYPSAMEGDYQGRLGMIQIIRYTEGPVGPYDELLIVPGFFDYERDGEEMSRVRISRIYVSQKYSAWNGRYNWNIPKHLAKFDWTEAADGTTTVKVYPFDTTGNTSEAYPADKPWFQTSFTPGGLLSNLPFSTDLYALAGINATLAQPPLPQGDDYFGVLVGTDQWQLTEPGQDSVQTSVGTFDLSQHGGDEVADGTNAVGDEYFANFWPELPSTVIGLKMEDTTITFGAPEAFN